MPNGDAEKSRGKGLQPGLTAAGRKILPLYLVQMRIGKQGHIRDLSDPHAAVEQMLVGMAEQKEQMIPRRESAKNQVLHLNANRTILRAPKQSVKVTVGLRIHGKEAFVQLDIEGRILPMIAQLFRRCGIRRRIVAEHPLGEEKTMIPLRLLRGDQQILVHGWAKRRDGIETAAEDSLQHDGIQPRGLHVLNQGQKLIGLPYLAAEAVQGLLTKKQLPINGESRERRKAGYGMKNQGKDLLLGRKTKKAVPLLLIKAGISISLPTKRRAKTLKKALPDEVHDSSSRTVRAPASTRPESTFPTISRTSSSGFLVRMEKICSTAETGFPA